jgi:hypothetical protein
MAERTTSLVSPIQAPPLCRVSWYAVWTRIGNQVMAEVSLLACFFSSLGHRVLRGLALKSDAHCRHVAEDRQRPLFYQQPRCHAAAIVDIVGDYAIRGLAMLRGSQILRLRLRRLVANTAAASQDSRLCTRLWPDD